MINKQSTIQNDDNIDLDHLLALSMEQQDILDAVILSDNDILDLGNDWIPESEIIAMLQSGIDIDAFIASNSTLTKEYILALKQNIESDKKAKQKAKHRSHKKLKKHNKKSQLLCSNNDDKHHTDTFINKFNTFPKQKKKIKNTKARNKRKKKLQQAQKAKKKKRKKKKNQKKNNDPSIEKQKHTFSEASVCNICNTSFDSKAKLFVHLQRNPKHVVKNASNWLKRRNLPQNGSKWIMSYKYGENAIVHDECNVYWYNIKQDTYKLIKCYDRRSARYRFDFWLSADLSSFHKIKFDNSSFYLWIMAIDGENDKVRISDLIEICKVEDEIEINCSPMEAFLGRVINIDPAKTLITGIDDDILFIMANTSLNIQCKGSEDDDSDQREVESANLTFKFVIYNLQTNVYEEKQLKLDLNTNDLPNSKYGGDFHHGIVGLDTERFLIFGENVMFEGVYNKQLPLVHEDCLRFERVYHVVRFGEVIKCAEVYWSFSYLKYKGYILVFGGETFGPIDDIIIYDICNKRWFTSDAKLPFPSYSMGDNMFIDNNKWVHYMATNCHYALGMNRILLLRTEMDCVINYWMKSDTIQVANVWLYDFNWIIYKYMH